MMLETADIWRTDPATLRDIVLDRAAMVARLPQCPELERIWILSLLDRTREAISEGQELVARSRDRLRPLLVLAQAYLREYKWHEAGRLQEEALRLAGTRAREALVRRQIGHRLFDEARYREAAAEFEWARDLYRSTGQREHLVQACQQALDRSRELSMSGT
jgi:tetratricopeptide (TPR) repeat protein